MHIPAHKRQRRINTSSRIFIQGTQKLMQVFISISMSFGLGPLPLLLSDSKQQKDLHCSKFPLNFSLYLPAKGWGGKTKIKPGVKQLLLCLQKCKMWDSSTYNAKDKLDSSASFSLLPLEDNESSSLCKEKIPTPFGIRKFKVIIVGHSGWVTPEAKTLSQLWAYRCGLFSHLYSLYISATLWL